MFSDIPGGIHKYPDGSKRKTCEFAKNLSFWVPTFSVRKEEFYGKELILADRDMVETESDEILRDADKEDVALLVVGDPFGYAYMFHSDCELGA